MFKFDRRLLNSTTLRSIGASISSSFPNWLTAWDGSSDGSVQTSSGLAAPALNGADDKSLRVVGLTSVLGVLVYQTSTTLYATSFTINPSTKAVSSWGTQKSIAVASSQTNSFDVKRVSDTEFLVIVALSGGSSTVDANTVGAGHHLALCSVSSGTVTVDDYSTASDVSGVGLCRLALDGAGRGIATYVGYSAPNNPHIAETFTLGSGTVAFDGTNATFVTLSATNYVPHHLNIAYTGASSEFGIMYESNNGAGTVNRYLYIATDNGDSSAVTFGSVQSLGSYTENGGAGEEGMGALAFGSDQKSVISCNLCESRVSGGESDWNGWIYYNNSGTVTGENPEHGVRMFKGLADFAFLKTDKNIDLYIGAFVERGVYEQESFQIIGVENGASSAATVLQNLRLSNYINFSPSGDNHAPEVIYPSITVSNMGENRAVGAWEDGSNNISLVIMDV